MILIFLPFIGLSNFIVLIGKCRCIFKTVVYKAKLTICSYFPSVNWIQFPVRKKTQTADYCFHHANGT